MQFNDNQPIWLQIYDYVCRAIASGKWPEAERIPSVRELAADMQVNPNTVMRSYEKLEAEGLITNRRGMGFYVAQGAPAQRLETQQSEFLHRDLALQFSRMDQLGIGMDTLQRHYDIHLKKKNHENEQ